MVELCRIKKCIKVEHAESEISFSKEIQLLQMKN
jgi:hypothetical protein